MSLLGRIANRSKDYLLFNPLLESHWLRGARGMVTSLLYHQIAEPGDSAFLARGGAPVTHPAVFREEMRFLVDRGVRFFTFGQLARGEFPGAGEVGVAVCFDDCFRNNYAGGLAILEELGVRATFFQSTAMVDADDLLWEHRLYWHTRDDAHAAAFRQVALSAMAHDARLQALSADRLVVHLREATAPEACERVLAAADAGAADANESMAVARLIYPTAAQLRHAQSLGHEIGSHGHRHYKRASISASLFEYELMVSSELLQRILGVPPTSFSYPFDSHLPADADVCRKYFSVAATVAKQRITRDTDRMWMPRFTWPGPTRNPFRRRRWLLTGTI
jgi:peptidoglycan/xylan/chitin deacetylase (PgdA/CDA1 family)